VVYKRWVRLWGGTCQLDGIFKCIQPSQNFTRYTSLEEDCLHLYYLLRTRRLKINCGQKQTRWNLR
jgi:hypothetical protein